MNFVLLGTTVFILGIILAFGFSERENYLKNKIFDTIFFGITFLCYLVFLFVHIINYHNINYY